MNNLLQEKFDPLIVYAIQMDISWKAKDDNIRKVQQLVKTIKPEPYSIIILPEMFCSGFCMDVADICEEPGKETEMALSEMAAVFNVLIIAGIPLRAENGKCKNAAVCFTPNGNVSFRFTKLHPFNPANEEQYYIRGDEIIIADYGGWKFSPFICYDLRFPESYRNAALEGTELLITIANWPEKRASHWFPLLQARAIENLAYSIGVNRVGNSPDNNYLGDSVIISPWGETIARAGTSECVLRAELSKQIIADIRKNFPCLEDARASLSAKIREVDIN